MDAMLDTETHAFLEYLKYGGRKSAHGSFDLASRCVRLLLNTVNNADWTNAAELIAKIREIGDQIKECDPTEVVPRNMVFRLLKIIRDEYRTISGEKDSKEFEVALQNMILDEEKEDYKQKFDSLKDMIVDSLIELNSELETSAENIATQALEHVYADEVIMTLGRSKTVEAFLQYAAKQKRKFQVIIAECAPFYTGVELANNLTSCGIATTLIPDSAIFAMMSKVNKVIIGTHSVMANGGLRAMTGSYSLALAAKHYSVPLIVCTAMFKLTPLYLASHDQVAFNRFSAPNEIMSSEEEFSSSAEIVNPVFDYVPPELVTILVSNIGGNSPSYIYRLLGDLYNFNDYLDN
ncbi:hypothetical protein B4U80_01697 [Leptotrombidium deliense]|uniref:Translation initiation factor eIF2B subunit beta n=1 Tax=Leptotrombidium deliense TaxID=299467 RepID=A0A443SB03_9ACAR|nr:hypothetical protein B4U80_01697 [Leptotrombidium deliense]